MKQNADSSLTDVIADAIHEAIHEYGHPQAVDPVGDAVRTIMAAVEEQNDGSA